MGWGGACRGGSGRGGARWRGGGEPECESLVSTEGDSRDNGATHIDNRDSERFPVAVERHDVLGEVQQDTDCVSLAEEVVFAVGAEGI